MLDGMDELPGDAQDSMQAALEVFTAPDRPVVVTSRPGAYERMVRGGNVLSRAAVVELKPVAVQDAVTFVTQGRPDPRWDPVFAQWRADPAGPLGQVLSSPLMIAMARKAFRDPQSIPASLLKIGTATALTARLMNVFVTTLYTNPVAQPYKG